MNINGPPIKDTSMNPNGYHQPYLPPGVMSPPGPHNVAGGPPHHNDTPGGGMPVGLPQQQQPPPAHPPQQQQFQSTTAGTSSAGGSNSNQGSNSGGESASGMTGHGAGSGNEGSTSSRGGNKKKSWPKKKKPDPNAPKQRRFLGYYVYIRERRGQLRSMYPEMPSYEIIRQLSQEWKNMDRASKQKYLDSAEADKQKYEREMSSNVPGTAAMNMMNRPAIVNHDSGIEIAIFTEDFIEYNKARELELEALKKTGTECGEQNGTLQKHVEQMQLEIERMDNEMRQQKLQNEMLSQNLTQLRGVVASIFASLPSPGTHEPPNIITIDNLVHFPPFNRVIDIIRRLEFIQNS